MSNRWALPWDDAYLLLAPRWGGTTFIGQLGVSLLLLLLCGGLVIWLYHYEMRLVRRLTAIWLLGLRALVVLVLLTVVLWQPSVVRVSVKETPRRVLVAVDQSGSMALTDPQRTPLEKLRLARAMGLTIDGQEPSGALLDFWIEQYVLEPHASSVTLVPPGEDGSDPLRRRALAERYRVVHDQLCAQIDRLSRGQFAQQLLMGKERGLLDRLAAQHQVELVGFGDSVWTLPNAEQADKVDATRVTDLRQPLLHGLENTAMANDPLLGIVILSDGRHNRGESPLGLARELGQRRLPIYALGLGSERSAADVAIVAVQAPGNVFHDVDAPIEAKVRVAGVPKGEIAVALSYAGKPPRAEHRKVLQHDGQDQTYPVRFGARFDDPGVHELEIKAQPVLNNVRETTLANNQAALVIRSVDENIRVLVIDGEARWEYHYLATALLRDPSVQAKRVVFIQPRIGALDEDKLEKIGHPKVKLPEVKDDLDPLRDFDCIILGDVSMEQLPLADRRRLARYVAERGGALVLAAGKRHVPLSWLGPEHANDPLVKLLPIVDPRVVQPVDGFRLQLSDEGYETFFMNMESDAQDNRKKWSEFPLHYWGVVGRLKPGATRLAFAHDVKKKEAPPTTDALIAHQRYGAGQMLYLGLDSTWRWRFKAGDTYHHRFWGQMLRWAAADKLLPAGNQKVRYGTREAIYRSGQPVDVAVRFNPDVGPLPSPLALVVRILPVGSAQASAVVTLAARSGQPRLFEGQVRDLVPGKYRVELDLPPALHKFMLPGKKAAVDPGAFFSIAPPEELEAKDFAVDWQLLKNLARESDGQFWSADNVDGLLELLARQVTKTETQEQLRPWRDEPAVWWLLGGLLSLLTLEWISRKLARLA